MGGRYEVELVAKKETKDPGSHLQLAEKVMWKVPEKGFRRSVGTPMTSVFGPLPVHSTVLFK